MGFDKNKTFLNRLIYFKSKIKRKSLCRFYGEESIDFRLERNRFSTNTRFHYFSRNLIKNVLLFRGHKQRSRILEQTSSISG